MVYVPFMPGHKQRLPKPMAKVMYLYLFPVMSTNIRI